MSVENYYGLALDKDLANDPRQEKWQKQRLERGFDDTELWSLDSTIIKFILPRLKAFYENERDSWKDYEMPERKKEYFSDLKKIIEAFEKYEAPLFGEEEKQFTEIMHLFVKRFQTLWT